MNNKFPFIHTTEWTSINQAYDFDNQNGVKYRQIEGEHAIWAARVPFLPAMLTADLTRAQLNRISIVQLRQFRFIYDLARIKDNQTTFVLRFISSPNDIEGQPNFIDIVFLGKAFSKHKRGAQPFAEMLWEKFLNVFPMEDPFGYPLEPITSEKKFWRYYQPFDYASVTNTNLYEIRKYEEIPIRQSGILSREAKIGDYLVHPFVPSQSVNPMSRFFMSLASQPEKCYVDISLRPTKMFEQEIFNVSYMVGQFKETALADGSANEEYISKRSQIGLYVYNNLMLEREQLLMVRVYIVGEVDAPKGLAEALGSEMMGNADNKYPTSWVAAQPVDEKQLHTAVRNIQFLEHDFWGNTIAPTPLIRLRYFSTAQEAYGAFRLPTPPESGYIPGVLVRNEPFNSPIDALERREQDLLMEHNKELNYENQPKEKRISLGRIYHRGASTQEEFTDLTRHTWIAGSTGSGKSTTIKHILSQLWIKHQIPFMVLYPVNKNDYRELIRYQGLEKDLLVFTLGDETTSPFRFNPFSVPDGIMIKTHISRLMRIFESAFSLMDPLPMVYREALRKVYRDKGWEIANDKGGNKFEYPIMSEYFKAIKVITENLNYSGEIRDNVRQASVIRIGDLLENAGQTVNVRKTTSFEQILNCPAIMELGRIGSTDDIALIMGFLLVCFAEEVEKKPRPRNHPHITVIEEAHRLMSDNTDSLSNKGSPRRGAGEDFGNLLAEVRAYGEGLLIAEQIPTTLVKGAIGNTFTKIMHWIEDAPSFELFSQITNLNDTQKVYARSLKPGFAIVRSVFGQPVHVKVPNFGDQQKFPYNRSNKIDDQSIRSTMTERRRKLDLKKDTYEPWDLTISNESKNAKLDYNNSNIVEWALFAPMQTCLLCLGRTSNKCLYKRFVEQYIFGKQNFHEKCNELLMAAINSDSHDEVNKKIQALINLNKKRFSSLREEDVEGHTYCYIAHEIDSFSGLETIPARSVARGKKLLKIFKLLVKY